MRLPRRESIVFKFFLSLLVGSLVGGNVSAATIDYSADAVLARTTVTVQADSLSLAEALTLVENQTTLRFFVIDVERLPLNARVMMRGRGEMSLAGLLMEFSAQAAITFGRRDNLIDVRVKGSDDTVVTAPVSNASFSDRTALVEAETPFDAEMPRYTETPVLVGSFFGGNARAATIDYSADAVLAGTTVSVQTDSLSLSEALTLVENQTTLRFFVFDAQRLPLSARVKVKDKGEFSLAGLLTEFSAQAAVSFRRRNNLIDVRGKGSDETFVTAPVAIEHMPAESAYAESTRPGETPEQKPADAESGRPGSLAANVPAVPASVEETPARTRLPASDVALATADADDDVLVLEAFSVTGEVTKGSVGDLRSMRTKAEISVDFLSAAEIAKFSAGDLAEAVFRMPGISVADGQFAVVRGLSDRFLSTTLNGLKLPSPDPEKQAFQLDLIPTSAVEAVVVSKAFEPRLWAESTGGAMDIFTRTVPQERFTSISFGLKVNDNVFDGLLDYATRDSSLDERLGFGSRTRLNVLEVDQDWQYVPGRRNSVPLGTAFSIEHANIIPIAGEQRIGLLLSLSNEAIHGSQRGLYHTRLARRAVAASGGNPARPSDFETEAPVPMALENISDYVASSSEYTSTAALGLGYAFSEKHNLKFTSIWVQTGDDQAFVSETTVVEDPNTGELSLVSNPYAHYDPIYSYFRANEYFRERNLTALQLAGDHEFGLLGKMEVDWALQRTNASQKEHPFVESEYATSFDNYHEHFLVLPGNDAPIPLTVVWSENEEAQTAARFDAKWSFLLWGKKEAQLTIGAALESSERDVVASGMIYNKPNANQDYSGNTPNAAMRQAARSVNFGFESVTEASRDITAYHANLSLPLFAGITLTGGARFEDYAFDVSGVGEWAAYSTAILYDPSFGGAQYGRFLGTTRDDNPPFASRKWYPGAALRWDLSDSLTLRLAYSQTDGRPSFREVSPFFNKSVESGNLVVGNPALKPSEAKNYDVRLEWRPDRSNFISVSWFQKKITNPIEKFLLDTRSAAAFRTEIWVNNPVEAEISGFEFEVRHGLDTWSESLGNFSIGGNFTLIDAEVPEHPIAIANARRDFLDPARVPSVRRLFDQPEHIANLDFTWSDPSLGTRVTLAAFAISDTLDTAGLQSFAFDLYEREYVSWDLIVSQSLPKGITLKFTAKNLNDPVRGTIYDRDATAELVPSREYHSGRAYSLSVEAAF